MCENPKNWEDILPLAEFSYNSSIHRSINTSPFEAVYGSTPSSILDLAPLQLPKKLHSKAMDMVEFMKKVHAQVRSKIIESNAKYKATADVHQRELLFDEDDLVWVVLSKERQPQGSYSKLNDKKVGPCKSLAKVNDNAYKVHLPPHLNISNVFNVKHLVPYYATSGSPT